MHKIMINHTHPRDNKRPGYSAVKNIWTRNGPETDQKRTIKTTMGPWLRFLPMALKHFTNPIVFYVRRIRLYYQNNVIIIFNNNLEHSIFILKTKLQLKYSLKTRKVAQSPTTKAIFVPIFRVST